VGGVAEEQHAPRPPPRRGAGVVGVDGRAEHVGGPARGDGAGVLAGGEQRLPPVHLGRERHLDRRPGGRGGEADDRVDRAAAGHTRVDDEPGALGGPAGQADAERRAHRARAAVAGEDVAGAHRPAALEADRHAGRVGREPGDGGPEAGDAGRQPREQRRLEVGLVEQREPRVPEGLRAGREQRARAAVGADELGPCRQHRRRDPEPVQDAQHDVVGRRRAREAERPRLAFEGDDAQPVLGEQPGGDLPGRPEPDDDDVDVDVRVAAARVVPLAPGRPRPMPVRSVLLVRHAETAWSIARRHTGRTDLPLTDDGRDAARALRPRLAERSFALVLTSPLGRAAETAALAGLGTAEPEPDLMEWDYGEYEGITTRRSTSTGPTGCCGATGAPAASSRGTSRRAWTASSSVSSRSTATRASSPTATCCASSPPAGSSSPRRSARASCSRPARSASSAGSAGRAS
jgi:hypothetical protein